MIRLILFYGVTLIGSSLQAGGDGSQLGLVKQWNLLNYNFEWNAPVNDKNFYNGENIVATGLALSSDRIFVATPRLFSGVPATVSSVPRDQFGDSPLLDAYPDWSFHTTSFGNYNCSDLGLVSVYRLRIDSCNRLWALDAGVSRSLEDYEITCPPKILIFDLATNQVVRRIDFPREVRRGETLFTNLIIDETTSKPENNCDDVFVYISDTVEPAIVVYDSARDLTWRLSHPSMFPDPDFAETRIGNDRFTLMDGVVGLGFDAKAGLVYFQPLATDRLFSISTEALRAGPFPRNQAIPVKLVGRKASQGVGLAVSPIDGSVFFSPMTETAVASWNPVTSEQKILAYDPEAFQFVADMSLAADDPTGIYIISSKFQRYFLKTLNPGEINVRILRVSAGGLSQSILPSSNPIFGGSRGQYSQTVRPATQYSFVPAGARDLGSAIQFRGAGYSNKDVTNPFFAISSGKQIIQTTAIPSTSYATFSQPTFGTAYKHIHLTKRS